MNEKLSPKDKFLVAFTEMFPDFRVESISVDKIPTEAMEYFIRKSECFRPEGSYSPEDFIEAYKVLRGEGSYTTYIVKEIKEIKDYGFEEDTYFADVDEQGELIGTSELRYKPDSDKEFFKDKPFLGNIRTNPNFLRQGFGIRRIELMDGFSRIQYQNPLYSDEINSEEMIAVWEKLVADGRASKTQLSDDEGDVRYAMI
jgi:hypothetical protein